MQAVCSQTWALKHQPVWIHSKLNAVLPSLKRTNLKNKTENIVTHSGSSRETVLVQKYIISLPHSSLPRTLPFDFPFGWYILIRCSIPVRHNFPVHKRVYTHGVRIPVRPSVVQYMCSTYCATLGLYRNDGDKCLHLLVYGSGVLCKLECYTGNVDKYFLLTNCILF